MLVIVKHHNKNKTRGKSIHWTGLLDQNTRLDYWTDIILVFTHAVVESYRLRAFRISNLLLKAEYEQWDFKNMSFYIGI